MSKKKILVVEDEECLAEMYEIKFTSEGYDVKVARDGQEGVKKAGEILPDLVLLDIVMPKMNGYDVLRVLRSQKKTRDLRIYVLSNLGQEEEIRHAYDVGADGYFIKTNVTPEQLTDDVKKILQGKKDAVRA